jgi:hypothetical protein
VELCRRSVSIGPKNCSCGTDFELAKCQRSRVCRRHPSEAPLRGGRQARPQRSRDAVRSGTRRLTRKSDAVPITSISSAAINQAARSRIGSRPNVNSDQRPEGEREGVDPMPQMTAMVLTAERRLVLERRPVPTPRAGQVPVECSWMSSSVGSVAATRSRTSSFSTTAMALRVRSTQAAQHGFTATLGNRG